jgi:hypothetical protein
VCGFPHSKPSVCPAFSRPSHTHHSILCLRVWRGKSGNWRLEVVVAGNQFESSIESSITGGDRQVQSSKFDYVRLPGLPKASEAATPKSDVAPPRAPTFADSTKWPEIRDKIGSAKEVQFTTAAQNQASGSKPDLILGQDGVLRANPDKKEPPKDGKLNVQVEGNESEITALRQESNNRRKAIEEMIRYFQNTHPGAPVPLNWLEMLTKEPNLPQQSTPAPGRNAPAAQETRTNTPARIPMSGTQGPQNYESGNQQYAGGGSPRSYDGGGSPRSYDGGGRASSNLPYVPSDYGNAPQNPNGFVNINYFGGNVDGDGAVRLPHDLDYKPDTYVHNRDGSPLNSATQSFVVLSQHQLAKYGIKPGDLGYLVDDKGHSVPVFVGDTGPERRRVEASAYAYNQLGYHNVDGGNGPTNVGFQLMIIPHSGDGRGIASTQELNERLAQVSRERGVQLATAHKDVKPETASS